MATAIGYAVAAGVALLSFKIGRRGYERAAFALAMGVVLLATPIVWLHYLALLLVPLAIILPRVGPLWMLPLFTFGCPPTVPSTFQIALVLGVFSLLVAVMVRIAIRGSDKAAGVVTAVELAPSAVSNNG
jgi:hypothetical protein